LTFTTRQLVIIALAVVAMLGLHVLLKMTRLGRAMRATAADAELARLSGINTRLVVLVTWAISGTLCGMTGVVLAMNTVVSTTPRERVPAPDHRRRRRGRHRRALRSHGWCALCRPGERDIGHLDPAAQGPRRPRPALSRLARLPRWHLRGRRATELSTT